MAARPIEIAGFLEQHKWGDAAAQPFDGDFSKRRYARLIRGAGDSAILMDADEDQKTPLFVALATILREHGVHAPDIYASVPAQGLVLMQDFGIRNIGALLDAGADMRPYMIRAAEIVAGLHRGFERTTVSEAGLPLYSTDLFVTQVELFLDTYVPFVKQRDASEEERQDFRAAWRAVLRPIEIMPKSLMLRDFMPDNLMDLPGGALGVLDFQDAGIGPVAYDLASLCEEVRRDGAFALLPDVISHYCEAAKNALSHSDLLRACTILSAQRHTRILGIIAQLAMKTGRREKLDFMPRILQHLRSIMKETYLLPVREWMERFESSAT